MFKGFQKPKRLVANTETLTERFGQFTAQPFERGFGSTIGTGLRRVLLSSIEGAAITAVRIEGVAHEFSPIPGVVEDATDIILNLKQVPFKMVGEGTRIVRLRIEGQSEVMSGQIETDADVEVLDRNLHIATIGEGGRLNIEMRIKQGRGYVSADRNYEEDLPIGYIPIDSVHSPVRKVNYAVEGARLGQNTEFDKLTRMPIQLVYGDYLDKAPQWARAYETAKQWVAIVNAHGGHAELLHLPDRGLHGNTHIAFADLNNVAVAALLSEFLHRNGLDKRAAGGEQSGD